MTSSHYDDAHWRSVFLTVYLDLILSEIKVEE